LLLETPKELPAPVTPPVAFAIDGLRAAPPPQPVTLGNAQVTVFPDVVTVTKDDAAAMQALIIKEYQAAFLDVATRLSAAGKPVRFSVSLDGAGNVESLQFMNPAQAGTPEFRDAVTGLVMKWKFPDLHRAGAATVQIETTAEAAPPEMRAIRGLVAVAGVMVMPPAEPATPQVAKPKSVTVVPGIVATPTAEESAPPAEKPASPAAEAPAAPVQVPVLGLTLRVAGVQAFVPPPQPEAPPAPLPPEEAQKFGGVLKVGAGILVLDSAPQPQAAAPAPAPELPQPGITSPAPQDPELVKQQLKEQAQAPKNVTAAKPDAGKPANAKAAAPAVSEEDAAAIQARITKEYMAAFVELAGRLGEGGKTVRFTLTLDGKGGVESLQFLKAAQDTGQGFRDELTRQVMKWKFLDVKTPGDVTLSIETTTEAAPLRPLMPSAGTRIDPPPPPPIVKPGRVTAVPGIVAARLRAGGKPIRFSVSLNAAGNVESLQFLSPAPAGGAEFRDGLTGQVLKWKFPGLRRPGAATVSIETTAEDAPVPPNPEQFMDVAGLRALPPAPPPVPQIVHPKGVTVVPGVVTTPPAEAPATPPAAAEPAAAPAPNFTVFGFRAPPAK
jgi:hypothetical protein